MVVSAEDLPEVASSQHPDPGDGWLTRAAAAKLIGATRSTIRRLEVAGALHPTIDAAGIHRFDPVTGANTPCPGGVRGIARSRDVRHSNEVAPAGRRLACERRDRGDVQHAARIHSELRAVLGVPWPGDPRVNIQNAKGKAKPYQVRQVLKAIAKLKDTRETKTK